MLTNFDQFDIIKVNTKNAPCFSRAFYTYSELMRSYYHQLTGIDREPISVSIQVTKQCNLCCTYCFQDNKTDRVLSIDDGKKFIDLLLEATPENNRYVNPENKCAIILGFVGGDALLQIDIIDELTTYFVQKMLDMNHPWLDKWMFHLDTNGVLYKSKKVQNLLKKWGNKISCIITVDGDKELHDKCRIFPNGKGSYDYAAEALNCEIERGLVPTSKITVAPENIDYIVTGVKSFINDLGMHDIAINVVMEDVWTDELASKYYYQLRNLAQFLIDNDLYDKVFIKCFTVDSFRPYLETELEGFCGGNGKMLALDADGHITNCYRYQQEAIKPEQKPYQIGHVDRGIGITEEDNAHIDEMWAADRRKICDDECFYCPIAKGCSYCFGLNYREFDTPSKRTKYHCACNIAEALASAWYHNAWYRKYKMPARWTMNCPEKMALRIISKEEYEELKRFSEF